ncbi:MAG: PfkB family carbohydrate kinase [Dysgonamonadaceae bacterium]|nr:PfkB family carbohydrate kinase [Dysgonamonadaceae bacterium]
MKIDLLYAGNISLDKIVCFDSSMREIWGGSALYSALASRAVFNGSIGIYSVVGNDFDSKVLSDNDIIFFGKKNHDRKSNTFIIDEKNKKCSLENKNYLKFAPVNQSINVEHLHVSFREGVPIERIFSGKIKFQHLSVDVMHFSVTRMKNILLRYLKDINIIFCNQSEYNSIKDILDKSVEVFVTDEEKAVRHYINGCENKYQVPKIVNKNIKSTTGAGDTFIGGFLGSYLGTGDCERAVSAAINLSGLSLSYCGNLDLIRSMDKNSNIKL